MRVIAVVTILVVTALKARLVDIVLRYGGSCWFTVVVPDFHVSDSL